MAWLPPQYGWAQPKTDNTFLSALSDNSNLLLGLGSGLLSGDLGKLPQAIAIGAEADTNAAKARKDVQQQKANDNATSAYIKAQFPDLASLPINQAWQIAQQRIADQQKANDPYTIGPGEQRMAGGKVIASVPPNTAGAGAADPADVASYKFYANQELQAGRQPKSFADYQAGTRPGDSSPSGYRWTADGKNLEPIPGGPSDPNSAQAISPEALDLIATQYLTGDKSAITGYARNANMRAQIANAVALKANELGMDGKAIAAEISSYGGNVAAQRAAGTRAAQVGMAASEASQMADIALQASAAVPRNSIVPWNAAVNAFRTGTSSPEMAAFVTATTSLVNAYARAVSPLGAPTDAMRQHAEAMLNTAQGPEAYAAVIAQMKKEMEAALNAPAEISSSLKTSITGSPPTTGAGTATKTLNGVTYTQDANGDWYQN